MFFCFFFFQAEDGIRDDLVTGVQTCALPISGAVTAPKIDMRSDSIQKSLAGPRSKQTNCKPFDAGTKIHTHTTSRQKLWCARKNAVQSSRKAPQIFEPTYDLALRARNRRRANVPRPRDGQSRNASSRLAISSSDMS